MRDHHTARHSAAVARYTRAMAEAAGLHAPRSRTSPTPPGCCTTSASSSSPTTSSSPLTPAGRSKDWQLIKMHPYQGAKVVREVEGYGPVADIIWAHHERIDGMGYPRGLERLRTSRSSRG